MKKKTRKWVPLSGGTWDVEKTNVDMYPGVDMRITEHHKDYFVTEVDEISFKKKGHRWG